MCSLIRNLQLGEGWIEIAIRRSKKTDTQGADFVFETACGHRTH
jgi:hypothetical protein